MMNSVPEVVPDRPLDILVSNFSDSDRLIPKVMIISYATRSSLALVSLYGTVAQDMCGVLNIFGPLRMKIPI